MNPLPNQPTTRALPSACPSCRSVLSVCELACEHCDTQIRGRYPLPPHLLLRTEDQAFMHDFVLASGSLKALAKSLGVSYPTVRNRLDDVIERLRESLKTGEQP